MDSSEVFERKRCSFKNKCDTFYYNGNQSYDRQYFNIYRCRLDTVRPALINAVEKKFDLLMGKKQKTKLQETGEIFSMNKSNKENVSFSKSETYQTLPTHSKYGEIDLGKSVSIKKLADLEENEKCVVIGTIYKDQALKPSILKQIAEEINTLPQPVKMSKFTESGDKLILEDEDLRVLLTGDICPGDFVCGVSLAVYGSELEGGKFNVEEILLPEIPSSVNLPKKSAANEDVYVLLISGLYFCGKTSDDAKQWFLCKSLLDWLTGTTGDIEEQRKISKISRVIIAGNSISDKLTDKSFGNLAKYLTRKTASPSVEAVRNLDAFLETLATCVDVDLMPGEYDPVNHFMPQQPLHKCVLPKASRLSTMNNVTNPYMAEIDGLTVLGTSGQNIDDIYRFSDTENRLELVKRTLLWRHLSPTSPDTLDCYPFYKHDPFIINERPDIYFVGNQPEFSSDLVVHEGESKTLVITLPNFASTGFCALVNLSNLSIEPIEFVCDVEMKEEH